MESGKNIENSHESFMDNQTNYLLDDDIGERNDMANTRPEKVAELASILSNHLRQSGAKMAIHKRSGEEVPLPDQISH